MWLTRNAQFVRYIQWFITLPLLLLGLLIAIGLPLSDILTTLFMAIVLVVAGLVGALVPSTYKWGYYVFGLVALFYIWYVDHILPSGILSYIHPQVRPPLARTPHDLRRR